MKSQFFIEWSGVVEFEFDRSKTVCFTGHRPEKLPCSGNDDALVTKAIKSMISKFVIDSIHDGYNCFITGVARGVDLWAGEIVLFEKSRFKDNDIKLIAAVPYKDHGKGFKGYEKWQFGNILHKADEVIYVSEKYHKGCMRTRNEFMVDNSSRLIAAISDYISGSGQTVRMARDRGLDIKIVNIPEIEAAANQYSDEDYDIVM